MISRLIQAIREKHAPVVVGLDPNLKFIPEHILREAARSAKESYLGDDELEVAAEAVWRFNRAIIDATCDLIPAVKPQSAMYEQFGVPGAAAYLKTIRYCHEKGLIVIGDIKRGDIGSTSEAYATGHLGRVEVGGVLVRAYDEDMATVNPYLGTDGVKPFVDVCAKNDKGIFVLVKTSNPSSGEFQDVVTDDGRRIYERVADMVNIWGGDLIEDGYSNVGAVVGATYPEQGRELRKRMKHAYILVPGYGAQGGRAEDLVNFFNEDGLGAIVNSSRGIIAAYKSEAYSRFGAERFAEASRAAVKDMIADIRSAMEKAGLPV